MFHTNKDEGEIRLRLNIEEIERLVKLQLKNGEADALLEPLRELASQRRYGLVWEEPNSGAYDEEIAENELLQHFPFLEELTDRAIIKDTDKPSHLLIEGDNLHALQAMQYTHKGKVDVIYIDPPYNTGGKDFMYNDRFVDKEDSWRHSSWLSFMNKRLRLAKELMTEDGIIFLSIDDHEQAQLKLLCDLIFGEQNLVSNMIWQRKTGASDAKGLATITEYVLVYCKNPDLSKWNTLFSKNYESHDEKRYRETDEYVDERGPFYYDTLDRGGLSYSDSLNYGIECPDGTMTYPNGRTEYVNDGWNWKWGKQKLTWGLENGFIEIRKTKAKASGWGVYYKNYLLVDNEGNPNERGAPFKNLIQGILNGEGTRELNNIFGESPFKNPKPTRLIKQLLSLVANKNAIVLDYFAGSGTSGQAVLELNEEDGGNRQVILCTNNEVKEEKENNKLVELGLIDAFVGRKGTKKYNEWIDNLNIFKSTEAYQNFIASEEYQSMGIARAVTYKRMKKVINGYTTPKGKVVDGLPNNFRHFVVSLKEDYNDDEYNSYKLIGDTVDLIRIKENIFHDMTAESINGIPMVKLLSDDKVVCIVLDTDVIEEDIEALIETYPDDHRERVLYTSYTDYLYTAIRFEELPKEILRALKLKEMK